MTEPGSCHQTAAATTTASPNRNSPAPSRRCSGSRSPAELARASCTTPTTCAAPSQTPATAVAEGAEQPRDRRGPLRTARGAGRFFGAGLRCWWLLPDERDRELEPPFADVLLLRDAGGEDVRVAMVANVRESPTCPTCHTPGVTA